MFLRTKRNDNQSKNIFNKDEFNSVIYEAKLCQNKNEITEQKCIIKIQFFIEFLAVSFISVHELSQQFSVTGKTIWYSG